jgi:CheY-like chemotaxis protein
MTDDKGILQEVAASTYSPKDIPFDFLGEENLTALVCESDPALKATIVEGLSQANYYITEAGSTREALKSMRFHVYEAIVLNEMYESENPDKNIIMEYLNSLPISVRRKMFVVLVSKRFRTMDNMAAFNRSVNMVVNAKNIDEFGVILKRGVDQNDAFYHVFRETMTKLGRI